MRSEYKCCDKYEHVSQYCAYDSVPNVVSLTVCEEEKTRTT